MTTDLAATFTERLTDLGEITQQIESFVSVITKSEAIEFQSTAVGDISTNLTAVTKSARDLRARFQTLDVA